MFGRKQSLHDSFEDTSNFVQFSEEPSGRATNSSKAKTKSQQNRGFFRRGAAYDELKDDWSDGSTASPTKSIISSTGRDLPSFDRDSTSSIQTQRSSILGTVRSIGFTSSIKNRDSAKEDANEGAKKANGGSMAKTKEKVSREANEKKKHRGLVEKKKCKDTYFKYGALPDEEEALQRRSVDSAEDSTAMSVPASAFSQDTGNGLPHDQKPPTAKVVSSAAKFWSQAPRKPPPGTKSLPSSKDSSMHISNSADRLNRTEDSALDSSSDAQSPEPGEPIHQSSRFRPLSAASDMFTTPLKPPRTDAAHQKSSGQAAEPQIRRQSSPGALTPLLNAAQGSAGRSPLTSPELQSQRGTFRTSSADSSPSRFAATPFHSTSNYLPTASLTERRVHCTWTDPLPQRRPPGQAANSGLQPNLSRKFSSETKPPRPTSLDPGMPRLPEAALDIFEPRPDAPGNSAVGLSHHTRGRSLPGNTQKMTGHDALKALEKGALLRKKWIYQSDMSEAPSIPKTERLIRCRLQDGKVLLHYHHKGMKGFLEKEELKTQVQRVEIVDGAWREGDCLLLHTGRGVLALSAPDAATYATWSLGLNAALKSSQQLAGNILLEAPVHAIPRDAMFVVKEPSTTSRA